MTRTLRSGASRLARLTGRAFLFTGQLALTALFFGWMGASVYTVGALMDVQEPTERCFTDNLRGAEYCRTQLIWEIK